MSVAKKSLRLSYTQMTLKLNKCNIDKLTSNALLEVLAYF